MFFLWLFFRIAVGKNILDSHLSLSHVSKSIHAKGLPSSVSFEKTDTSLPVQRPGLILNHPHDTSKVVYTSKVAYTPAIITFFHLSFV